MRNNSPRSATAVFVSDSSRRKSASAPYVCESTLLCASYFVLLTPRDPFPFLDKFFGILIKQPIKPLNDLSSRQMLASGSIRKGKFLGVLKFKHAKTAGKKPLILRSLAVHSPAFRQSEIKAGE